MQPASKDAKTFWAFFIYHFFISVFPKSLEKSALFCSSGTVICELQEEMINIE